MKILRALSIAFSLLVPAAAIASPTVRACATCPTGDCGPDCPFCPSHLHA